MIKWINKHLSIFFAKQKNEMHLNLVKLAGYFGI
jgi:hypothetical protein